MLKLTNESMANAIERAKTERMKVRVINADARTFAVTSKGKTYTVRFVVANGHKLGSCDCAARTHCKHLAAAASLNIAVQSMRQPTPAESKAFLARNVGWCI